MKVGMLLVYSIARSVMKMEEGLPKICVYRRIITDCPRIAGIRADSALQNQRVRRVFGELSSNWTTERLAQRAKQYAPVDST
jgi:hypothetical protein